MRRRHFILLPLFAYLAPAAAQDLHNSQFYLNPLHLSPAAAGVFEGNLRVSGLYRSQWQSVPVAYTTYALAADWKALRREKSQFSVGLLIQQDQSGDANLSWTQAGISASAAHALNQSNIVSLGFGLAAVQRSVDLGRLTFKNQWTGDNFDPAAPSRESFGQGSGLSPSLSAGLAWHYQNPATRDRLALALGAFHLNRPVVTLGGIDPAKSPIRVAFFGEGIFQVSTHSDLVAVLSAQYRKRAKEIVIGGGMRQILSTGIANYTAVRATLCTRPGDALIPALQLERNNWTFGLSYDWNISAFSEATNGRGGMEIAVVWRVVPVPITETVKCCPVF